MSSLSYPVQAECWEIPDPRGETLQRSTRQIESPGHGEALLAVRALSLNFRDLLQLAGTYIPDQKLPLIPLFGRRGEVLAIGPGVTEVKVGDRVAAHGLPGWQDGPFDQEKAGNVGYGGPNEGVLTTHRHFLASSLVQIPDGLSYVEASTLPVAGVTAWGGVITHGQVKPGDLVVIQGTGGVSLCALQFALAAGAITVVTSSSNAKLDQARGMGAHHAINYATTPNWAKAMKALTGGRGADVIIEVAGDLEQSLRAVRSGGTIAAIGVLNEAKPTLNLPLVVMRAIRILGVTLGSHAEMKAMMRAVENHNIRPVVDRVFPFDQALEAFDYYGRAKMFGKVVIEMP